MTSARAASLKKIARPSSLFRFNVIARLLRWRFWKSGPSRRLPVASTSSPDGSILITRAPQSASWRTAVGPARCAVKSRTRKSFNGSGTIVIGRFSLVSRSRVVPSPAGALAKNRVGGLPLCRRQRRIQGFQSGQKPLQAGQLDLVVLNLRAQIINGRCVRRRLARSAGPCPGVLPHHIGDGGELGFLGGCDLQFLTQARNVGFDIRRGRGIRPRLSQYRSRRLLTSNAPGRGVGWRG